MRSQHKKACISTKMFKIICKYFNDFFLFFFSFCLEIPELFKNLKSTGFSFYRNLVTF